MSKIILVQINYSQDRAEKILPLGILSVGSALKGRGFEVELMNISEKEINKTADYIVNEQPFFAGLSVMTGIQTKHSAELSKKIKDKSDIKILWGGIHPSLMPEQCLKEEYVDLLIVGEGEETMVELAQKLKNNESLSGLLGLGYKDKGGYHLNSERPLIKNLDEWPLDFSLLPMAKYIYKLDKYERVVAYKTSRGCPFNCAFCYNRFFNKNRWRAWSVSRVVKDLEYLKKNYNIDAVKFYDDNFFVDKLRALEILQKINLPAHLEVRIDMIDDALSRELKERKVFDLLIGVESGSDRILRMINKNITVERILAAVKSLAKYDLPASYSAIVGLPSETKEEFESTIDLLYKIYKIHPKAAFTLGAYMPYPGSTMYDFAIKAGFNPPVRTEDWGKIDRFRKDFSSPWIDGGQVWVIREYFKLLKFKLGPVNKLFEFRIKRRFFAMPIDIYFIEWLAGLAIEERGIAGKLLRRAYKRISKQKPEQNSEINFNRGKLLSGRVYPEFFPIAKNETVLNVGCGDGVQAVVYKGNFKKMVGVDINQQRLDTAKKLARANNINNFETICANVEEIPLEDKFDKTIAIDIIEHVINPGKVLVEIDRLLKDEGYLLMTFPVLHDKWENFFRFVGRKILRRKGKTIRKEGWDPDAHQYDYKLSEWFGLMAKGGFRLVNFRASTIFPPLHYLGLPRFWFSNNFIHAIDGFFCRLLIFRAFGQAAVCIFKKKKR